ncbi:MAG: hypothetical protein AABW50_05705 [Nanoarchaeota archaeon]
MTTQIAEKVKVIKRGEPRSFTNLDVQIGDYVGFENSDENLFSIVKARGKIERGNFGEKAIGLWIERFSYEDKNLKENCYLRSSNGIVLKRPPLALSEDFKIQMPNVTTLSISEGSYINPNIKGNLSVYSGEDEILKALEENNNLYVYADWLQNEFERLKSGR